MEAGRPPMEAGRELDALVAERVMGWTRGRVGIREQLRFYPPDGQSPTGAYPVDVGPGEEWSPSTDIAADYSIHRHACGWIFSRRRVYFGELDRIIQARTGLRRGIRMAWPDALSFYQPGDFSRAALVAVELSRPAMAGSPTGQEDR